MMSLYSKKKFWQPFFTDIILWWICKVYIDGSVQDCSYSHVLAMELLQSCTKPWILLWRMGNVIKHTVVEINSIIKLSWIPHCCKIKKKSSCIKWNMSLPFPFFQSQKILKEVKWYQMQSYCNFAQKTAVSLPCTVQNLTHWGRDKMAAISQMSCSSAFSWMKMYEFHLKVSLNFVPKFRISIIPALVEIMAWHRPGDKPLCEPMMFSLLMHIYITWPQWVKMRSGVMFHIATTLRILSEFLMNTILRGHICD